MKCKHLKEWDVNGYYGVHCKECRMSVTATFINGLLEKIEEIESITEFVNQFEPFKTWSEDADSSVWVVNGAYPEEEVGEISLPDKKGE